MNLPSLGAPDERGPRPNLLQRAFRTVLRLGIALVALSVVLGALVLGAVLALGVLGWAWVRGRKPRAGLFRAAYRQARQRPDRAAAVQVVDVEAHVVPEPTAK